MSLQKQARGSLFKGDMVKEFMYIDLKIHYIAIQLMQDIINFIHSFRDIKRDNTEIQIDIETEGQKDKE